MIIINNIIDLEKHKDSGHITNDIYAVVKNTLCLISSGFNTKIEELSLAEIGFIAIIEDSDNIRELDNGVDLLNSSIIENILLVKASTDINIYKIFVSFNNEFMPIYILNPNYLTKEILIKFQEVLYEFITD